MVRITGRIVTQEAEGDKPQQGAEVRLIGLLRHPPASNRTVEMEAPLILFVEPPVYARRPAGGCFIHKATLEEGEDLQRGVFAQAAQGQAVLRLSDARQLDPGDMLALGAWSETGYLNPIDIVPIASVRRPSGSALTGEAKLAFPLASSYPPGAPVEKLLLSEQEGVGIPLTGDAHPGDSCLFVESVEGLESGSLILIKEIDPPEGRPELEVHLVRLFTTASDLQGYYRLPPVSRVAQVKLEASLKGTKPIHSVVSPDYSHLVQRVDFVFRSKKSRR